MSKLGIMSAMYSNVAAYASPSWDEAKIVGDMAVNPSWEEGEAGTRQSRVVMTEATRMNIEVTGRMKVDPDHPVYEAFLDAFIQDEPIDIMVLNGKEDVDGSTGFRFWGKIFAFGEDQALGNVLFKDFTIKPCPIPDDDQYPKAVRVESGAPVFSDIGETDGS